MQHSTQLHEYFLKEDVPLTDGEIAKMLSIHVNTVQGFRKKHGIPNNFERLKNKYFFKASQANTMSLYIDALQEQLRDYAFYVPVWVVLVTDVAVSIAALILYLTLG